MKGIFFSFEGVEGSGKSTQVGLLGSKLHEKGIPVVAAREPGGTRIGEAIRTITHDRANVELTGVTEAYLMAASRAQLVREIIRPALDEGKIVLCDRFIDSSLAYQGFGREIGFEEILAMNSLAYDGVFPDCTFFLDVTPELGMKRKTISDTTDRLDLQQKDFYLRTYEGYKKLSEKFKDRYIVIDGTQSIEKIAETIWDRVKELIKQ